MLGRAVVPILNHVLSGEGWARERLRNFSGQHLRLAGGPLSIELAVDHEGLFRPWDGASVETPAVTIELPADAPIRLLSGGRESVFGAARLTGTADFAETLAFVFRNLRWDIEEDLSQVVGDIAARRLVSAGTAMFAWQRQAAANLTANVAEYLSEETAMLVPRRDAARFGVEVQSLQEEMDRLEKRLGHL